MTNQLLLLNELLNQSENDLETFSYWEIGKSYTERISWESSQTVQKCIEDQENEKLHYLNPGNLKVPAQRIVIPAKRAS